MADLPNSTSGRGFAIAFTIGDKGYMGTGTNDSFTVLYKDFWMYDPDSDKWFPKANYPLKRDALSGFVINGKAYAGGGTDNNLIYNEFYEYDPTADKWTQKSGMPNGATAFAMGFSINGLGYFVGGAGSSEYKTTYAYDPAKDTWTKKSDFPGAARQCGVGYALGNKGYVGLGQSSYSTVYKDLYSYDPSNDTWTKTTDFPGNGSAWPTIAAAGDKAYVGGGWDFGASFSDGWYEFTSDSTTGIESQTINTPKISLYPNPASEILYLQLPDNFTGNVSIKDINGKSLIYTLAEAKAFNIDISSLSKGFYILTYQNKQGVANTKFTKSM